MIPRANRLVLAAVLLAICSGAFAAEETGNPLFEQLCKGGLAVTDKTKIPLPRPVMADGLDAAGQQKVMEKVVGNRFSVRDFVGKVGTAPHVRSIRKIPAAGEDAPHIYGVDVYFVAHGGLATVAEKDFLENLHKKHKDRRIHLLNAEEMKKRELSVQSSKQREERYSHGVFIVLDGVELSASLRTMVTRQPDSLLAATQIDPRFARDSDFPNQWRKISVDEEGQRKFGPAQPYRGAGGYLKITRLHEPEGALFLEYHLIYSEPRAWFNGADPLRPKLPAIIQSEVRTFRQELNRVKK